MNAVLIVLTILAAVLFVALLAVVVLIPLGKSISQRRKHEVTDDSLPFDRVPSRTMAEKELIWEERRSSEDRRRANDNASDGDDRRRTDRRQGDRRRVNIPPPYPVDN